MDASIGESDDLEYKPEDSNAYLPNKSSYTNSPIRMENNFSEKKNVWLESKPKPYLRKEDTFLQTLIGVGEAIETFVRRYETQRSVNILDYELQKENSVASYFNSGVMRLNFTFQHGDEYFSSSVFIKVPRLAPFLDYAEELGLWNKERFIYTTALPLMYESWAGRKAVPDYHGSTDRNILVLENLCELKFYQKENGQLLSVSECGLVLESLAQYHALSLRHLDKLRAQLDSLTTRNKTNAIFERDIYPSIVRKILKHVLPSSSPAIQKTFVEHLDKVYDLYDRELSPNPAGLNVLLHGDPHYYNIMMRNDDEGVIRECKLFDFQWSRIGAPILDIMKCITTTITPEDFSKHCEKLFSSYLNAFRMTLKELDAGVRFSYQLSDLLADFEKFKMCSMYCITFFIPVFWSGQVDLRRPSEEDVIDKVLESAEYHSFFNGWARILLPIKQEGGSVS